MLTRMSPAFAVANCVNTHSLLLGDQMPMRSPGSSPRVEQSRGEPIDGLAQLAIAEPHLLMAHDQRRARRPFRQASSKNCPIVSPRSGLSLAPWT